MKIFDKQSRQRCCWAALSAASLLVLTGYGCGKSKGPEGSAKDASSGTAATATGTVSSASPTPTPKPSPLPIAATVTDLRLTIFDKTGGTVAQLTAKAGTMGSDQGRRPEGVAILKNGTATLYQNGKPAATLTAETLTADRRTRTVVGQGSVRVNSLVHKGAPALRADQVTWRHGTNKIIGTGNVLATVQNPIMRVPGNRFEADTEIRRFHISVDNKPVTGSF